MSTDRTPQAEVAECLDLEVGLGPDSDRLLDVDLDAYARLVDG